MNELSGAFIDPVLGTIAALRTKITDVYDAETAESIIGTTIEHALGRCKLFFENDELVTALDYEIFYEHAALSAMDIDLTIINELKGL